MSNTDVRRLRFSSVPSSTAKRMFEFAMLDVSENRSTVWEYVYDPRNSMPPLNRFDSCAEALKEWSWLSLRCRRTSRNELLTRDGVTLLVVAMGTPYNGRPFSPVEYSTTPT